MVRYLALILLSAVLITTGCKKKKNPLPTAMTFVMGKDTLWRTTNVVTDAQNAGIIYITGTSPDGTETLDLAISGFTTSKKTYPVDYRGPGGNIYGNTGLYTKASTSIMARTGTIVITEAGNDVIKGTFDLYYLQNNFKGSFTAPRK